MDPISLCLKCLINSLNCFLQYTNGTYGCELKNATHPDFLINFDDEVDCAVLPKPCPEVVVIESGHLPAWIGMDYYFFCSYIFGPYFIAINFMLN